MTGRSIRAIAVVAAGFIALTYLFAWSPVFTVKEISINGLPKQIVKEVLIKESGINLGDQMARIEPRSIERNLQEISWIKQAAISRHWINGSVTIDISARIPVGIFQGRAIDSSGALFDLPGNPPADLPVVRAATPELGLSAIELFTNLPTDMRQSLISISAANSSAITSQQFFGSRKVKIQWGSVESIAFKVSVYRKLLELPENKNVREVDLSAPHAPIVK
jgi:cell division septal protein FtsQ